MAIADKYINRLISGNKTSGLKTKLKDEISSDMNLEQDLSSGLQNGLQGSSQNGLQENTDTSKYGWQDYANMISAKTANSRAELQTAMQRAQGASNEYLKALGLQGSGLGQSQLSDIGVQYQNALSKVNAQAQSAVDTQLDTDFKNMADSGGYSYRQLQDYINNYGAQTGKSNEWNAYAAASGLSFGDDAKNVMNELNTIANGGTYELSDGTNVSANEKQKAYAEQLKEKLNSAYVNGNEEEFYKILDENNDFLNGLSVEDTAVASLKKNANGTYEAPLDYTELDNPALLLTMNNKQLSQLTDKWIKTNDYYYRFDEDGEVTLLKDGKTYKTDINKVIKLSKPKKLGHNHTK